MCYMAYGPLAGVGWGGHSLCSLWDWDVHRTRMNLDLTEGAGRGRAVPEGKLAPTEEGGLCILGEQPYLHVIISGQRQ